mgnify:CR=1 FL=1
MKQFITLALTLVMGLSTYAQNIVGTWEGALDIKGQSLRIVMHIAETNEGYEGTMDSPDQGAKGIPVTSTTFENSVLTMEIKNAKITYKGILNSDGVVQGTFKQAGKSLPLNLKKVSDEDGMPKRPQEPIAPYSYYSEDVQFENEEAGVTLAGTLTLPKKRGKFPVVVLISGSGPQDRDAQVFGHKPFLVLSDYLTRNGIGVLRYDDRGTASSTGDFGSATSFDFASDANAAVRYLQTRKEVNKEQIGLVGHSEGGLISPIVASNNKDVAYIVLLAGPGTTGAQILLEQQALIAEANGSGDTEIMQTREMSMAMFDLVAKHSDDVNEMRKAMKASLQKFLIENPSYPVPPNMSQEQFIAVQIQSITSPWMINFLTYNPQDALAKTTCPVLAINGDKDLQVPAQQNLTAIKKALTDAGNLNITTRQLKGMNHLFQECETGAPSEYQTIEETFSPIALSIVTNWILGQAE